MTEEQANASENLDLTGQAAPEEGQPPETENQEQTGATETGEATLPTEGQSQESDNLILGKFKSQEDLEKAYSELEKLKGKKEDDANLGRQFRELADNLNLTEDEVYRRITRGKEEQQDKPTEEKLAAMSTEELNKFIDNFNKNPRDTISKLAKEQAQEIVKQQTELQKAQKEFADAMITYPQIDKKSDSYDIEFHKAMDTLLKSTNYRMPVNEACNYVRLQFSEKSLNEQTAANQAQTDAQKKRAQTLSASGSGKSTPSRKPKSWDDAFAKAKEAIARGEY